MTEAARALLVCAWERCKKEFQPRTSIQRYCSDKCRWAARDARALAAGEKRKERNAKYAVWYAEHREHHKRKVVEARLRRRGQAAIAQIFNEAASKGKEWMGAGYSVEHPTSRAATPESTPKSPTPAPMPQLVASWQAEYREWVQAVGAWPGSVWDLPPPPFSSHLPGGGFVLDIAPPPKWPIEHRNVRALHGMVTGLIGENHADRMPLFTLIPGLGDSWGVHLLNLERARKLAGRTHDATLYKRPVQVKCSWLVQVRAPKAIAAGHHFVRLDATTPVCIRSTQRDGKSLMHARPSAANLLSTMAAWLPQRVGIELPDNVLAMEILENKHRRASVMIGEKYGEVFGWAGTLVLDVNAPALWLLKVAETLGLGGRTAFGFGRIKVTEVPR